MGNKIKVGILTFGDGRDFLQKDTNPVNEKFLNEIKSKLESDGFEVIAGEEVIWKNELAVKNGKKSLSLFEDNKIYLLKTFLDNNYYIAAIRNEQNSTIYLPELSSNVDVQTNEETIHFFFQFPLKISSHF